MYAHGKPCYENSFFGNCADSQFRGEVNPSYFVRPEVPARIAEMYGERVKVIVLLRHPLERAHSHYMMDVRKGRETRGFDEVIWDQKSNPYIEGSLYAKYLAAYLQSFGRENLKIFVFEEFFRDSASLARSMDEIYDFLQVRREKPNFLAKANPASQVRIAAVNRFLHSDSSLKRAAKAIFRNSNYRHWLALQLDRVNRKPIARSYDGPSLSDLGLDHRVRANIYEIKEMIGRVSLWGL